MNFIVALSM